jgi:predicted SAM-dependent methyltransferase
MSWWTIEKRERFRNLTSIMMSGLFDRRFYEMNNPDVPRGCFASLQHFLVYGGKEGRSPSNKFDSGFYLRHYPDVQEVGINPLIHFLRFGRAENRAPNPGALILAKYNFSSPSRMRMFLELLGSAKEGRCIPVDADLADIFGRAQPERSDVRRLIAEVFLYGFGIEVGALQDPLPTAKDVIVKYVDRFSKAELYQHYPELRGAPLVEVDIVDNGEQLFKLAPKSQDFVIANHFLEHTQDPIATLKNFCRVVRPGGYLYIAVPDQATTFDKDRVPTALQHHIDDHRNGPESSRHGHFVEWVTQCEPHFGRTYQPEEVAARVKELEDKDYSIHFHCWRADDFKAFLKYCSSDGGVDFKVSLFARCPGEIVVLLKVNS